VPITKSANNSASSFTLPDAVVDILQKVFILAIIASVALIGYLGFGLFSGQMADVAAASARAKTADLEHAMTLVSQVNLYLDVSVIVALACACVLYYEAEIAGFVMLLLAALLAYGVQFGIDFFDAAGRYAKGGPSEMTLAAIRNAGAIIAVPGVLLFLRSLLVRIMQMRQGPDLANMQYGKNAARGHVAKAPIAALAKCWQLPFCREGIRVQCPIFHAKTKCWKERVGCMCEENIIRLAAGGIENKPVDMTQTVGFVPIGDMIAKSEAEHRPKVQTRKGPRGVRIPTNPHLSEGQKRERCRNCIIYNEHQRQKYNFLAPLVTILAPVIAFTQFDTLRGWLRDSLHNLDALIAHLQFSSAGAVNPNLSTALTDSMFVEGFLILCLTLIAMTFLLRLLEYCTFKIKI
jgi:hypothetical protein